MAVYKVLDANNATQNLSATQDPSGNLVGSTCVTDPTTGQKAQVAQFHNADNQSPGAAAYGLLTGGVAQVVNILGNLDRQRETGADGIAPTGVATGAMQFAMSFKTSASVAISLGSQVVTPASMSGTVGGVPWSIKVGSVLLIDTGTPQENVLVTAITSTTFTATFLNNHSTTPIRILGFVYNQERDAAGENDGATGSGTALAAEYEFNAGDPSGGNFDRARSLNAKGFASTTISAGGGVGSSSLTISSAGTLQPGMKVLLLKSTTFPAAGSFESVNVDLAYIPGSTTVPLASTIVGSPTYDTLAYDAFAALGPQLNGFTPFGVGIEAEAIFDPVTGKMYNTRMAPGAPGVLSVSSDGAKATYRYGSIANTPAATPTDILTITGSATKTIRVKSVKLNGVATANGNMPVALIRRSTVDTTGTKTNPTPVAQDVNDAAATATLALYTANPGGLGTVIGTNGIIAAARLFLTTTATGSPVPTIFDFATRQDKAIILRGSADNLAVNLQGAAVPPGGVIDIEIEWEEDNS